MEHKIDIIQTLINISKDIYKVSKTIIYYVLFWIPAPFFICWFILEVIEHGNSPIIGYFDTCSIERFYITFIMPSSFIITSLMFIYKYKSNIYNSISEYFNNKIKYKENSYGKTITNEEEVNNYKFELNGVPIHHWNPDYKNYDINKIIDESGFTAEKIEKEIKFYRDDKYCDINCRCNEYNDFDPTFKDSPRSLGKSFYKLQKERTNSIKPTPGIIPPPMPSSKIPSPEFVKRYLV